MRVVTIVSLAASAVLGLGALVVAKTVLPHGNAKAAAATVAGVPVVVAAKDIKYGDKLAPEMLVVANVPANVAPQGSFTSVAQVLAADKGGAPVALVPITAKEPLLPAKLSGPGARPSVAAEIAEGMRAYTIKVTDVSGVGGHALPGDRVDVVLMRDLTPKGDVRSYVSQVVLQNVRVLGVDLNADLASNKPASPNTATLEVSVEDSQKLAIATVLGDLSLALRRTGAAQLDDVGLLRTTDFAIGGAPRPVVRRVSASAPRGPAAPAAPWSAILIIEGQPAKRVRRAPTPPTPPPALRPVAAGIAAGEPVVRPVTGG
jgi:pilus assembly protein CpaB